MDPDYPASSDTAESASIPFAETDISSVGLRLRLSSLAFDGDLLLRNLDLTLPPGRITCLLGPSGVGKTSILRIIAGFLPIPSESFLETSDGQPLTGRLSYMDQRDLLLPWARVRDNLLIGARLRGEVPDLARADTLLSRVGLEKWRNTRPDTLSGGMRQRVALARTLMEDSPVVLMDEPFSALDAITKYHLQALAARLLANRTVLLITHDPMEALRIGHDIYVLSGQPAQLSDPIRPTGKIPRNPTNDELKRHYSAIMSALAVSEGG
ncbi:MAG: ABC transporter ATP-binding protein [Sneathiella sp.]|jgi:putative hydroxymethylpyrimidine transport system ATP-binding protein|uniref:ABC transporter ATP-binding protein n=1 Tax=Sneathiella sp. TaxID=1964365 RepID=UPI000C51B975|nr:ATP-binding cassette domain-containing protein [Sneathiella sp.]MAL79484.1 ABC transporter ATP-binding protein [Sneathiella sp.]